MSDDSQSVYAPSQNIAIAPAARDYDKRQKKSGCRYWFAKLDYEIFRPLLIYKYDKEEMHLQDEALEALQNDVNFITSVYGKVNNRESGLRLDSHGSRSFLHQSGMNSRDRNT